MWGVSFAVHYFPITILGKVSIRDCLLSMKEKKSVKWSIITYSPENSKSKGKAEKKKKPARHSHMHVTFRKGEDELDLGQFCSHTQSFLFLFVYAYQKKCFSQKN